MSAFQLLTAYVSIVFSRFVESIRCELHYNKRKEVEQTNMIDHWRPERVRFVS